MATTPPTTQPVPLGEEELAQLDPMDVLAFLMQSAPFGQQQEEETLLGGFPLDFPASQPTLTETINVTQRRFGSHQVTTELDKYFEYDQWAMFSTKDPSYIVGIQNQMIQAGLTDGSNLVPGYWGAADADAMRQLLIEANAGNMSWEAALARRIQYGGPEQMAGPKFVMPTYMAPDYATLSQAVKSTFATLVGRDPKDYELALLADQLAADSRAEYEAQVSGQLAEFNAANPATGGDDGLLTLPPQGTPGGNVTLPIGFGSVTVPIAGQPPPAPTQDSSPRVVGGATVQAVDPLARLREAIQKKYGPEIEGEEDETELGANLQLLAANLAGLQGAVG